MNNLTKIALFAIGTIVYIGINSYYTQTQLDDFKAIHITTTWQIPQKNGDPISYTREPDIIYSKIYEIIREAHPISHTYVRINEFGKEIPDEKHPVTLETGFSFFICKKGEKLGRHFNSASDSLGEPYAVDSLINDFLRMPSLFYQGRGRGTDSIKTVKDEKNGLMKEIIINRKVSDTDPDSSYFYYRKKPLGYSFRIIDKRLDNMYLYKAVVISDHVITIDSLTNKQKKIRFFHSFEISDTDVPDESVVKKVIEKYKKISRI